MFPADDKLRPVGVLEKLYTARQALGIYHSVILTASYTIQLKLDDASLKSIFCAAISKLLDRHPSLCCCVEGEDTPKPMFIRLKTIETKDVLQISDLEKKESVSQKLQELHDQPWLLGRKPLWKLVVMREPQIASDICTIPKLHVAFVYHHVIGDGLSGAALHRSLLRELENVEHTRQDLRGAPKSIDTPTSVNLIEPIENLTLLPLSWTFLIKQVLQEYAPRWLIGAPPPIWAGRPPQSLDKCSFRSRARVVILESRKLERLIEMSKKHRTTLTSLLTAAIVLSLAEAVPGATRILGMTPYTLRRLTGTSMDEMVNQTSAVAANYEAKSLDDLRQASSASERVEGFWKIADSFNTEMQNELARCPLDNLIGLLPYVYDHVQYYQKKFGKAREATFELSNLGVFKKSEESLPNMWRLESMTFSQGAQPLGPAFAVNCVSVQGGPLTIAITWQDSVVDEDIIDTISRQLAELPSIL